MSRSGSDTLQLHANSSLQINFAQRACIHHASNSEQLKQFHQLKHGMIGQECLTIPCNVARCFNYNLLTSFSAVNVIKLPFFSTGFPLDVVDMVGSLSSPGSHFSA